MQAETRYTFGTDSTAFKRLGKLAEVFNPHSRAFIREHIFHPVRSIVDLGCGPGFTTRMLCSAVRAKEVYGLDCSEEFLVTARDLSGECVFVNHDITRTPLPVSSDAMYLRFVLSHLKNPVELLNRWSAGFQDSGIIIAEEVEDIETGIEVFQKYLAVNRGLVASQGAQLYVGGTISRGSYDAVVTVNECVALNIKDSDAAAMFYPNTVSIWENEEYVLDALSCAERREISEELRRIMEHGDNSSGAVWKMRRLVLEKDVYGDMFI